MRKSVYRVVFLILFVFGPWTGATKVRQLNLEEMTDRAGRILVGTCERVEIDIEPGFGPVTYVTFQVERSLKGGGRDEITLKFPGGQDPIDGRARIVGLPSFREGEEMVLFLYPESPNGFTSPVGFGQGKFLKSTDRNGKVVVHNGVGNLGLFRRLSPDGASRLGSWTSSGNTPTEALGFDTIQQMIEELRSNPEKRR